MGRLIENQNGYSGSNRYVIQNGRWYTVEVRRRLNDSGDNGIFQMWIDGPLISENRSVRYRVPFNGTYGTDFAYGTNFVMISDYTGRGAAGPEHLLRRREAEPDVYRRRLDEHAAAGAVERQDHPDSRLRFRGRPRLTDWR